MSDLYNGDAELVSMEEFNASIRAFMGPDVELPSDEYDRLQALSEAGARRFVDDCFSLKNFGPTIAALSYGEFAPDWPLCLDFAKAALGLLLIFAAVVGLGLRGTFFRLHYTKNEIDPKTGLHKRHAILGKRFAGGAVKFLEPQTMKWLDVPEDLKSYDRVRL